MSSPTDASPSRTLRLRFKAPEGRYVLLREKLQSTGIIQYAHQRNPTKVQFRYPRVCCPILSSSQAHHTPPLTSMPNHSLQILNLSIIFIFYCIAGHSSAAARTAGKHHALICTRNPFFLHRAAYRPFILWNGSLERTGVWWIGKPVGILHQQSLHRPTAGGYHTTGRNW